MQDRDLLKAVRVVNRKPYQRKINGKVVTLPPLVEIKVSPYLQSVIDRKAGDLKSKKDSKYGWFYKIRKHRPDAYVAANKRWEPVLDHLRKENMKFFFQGSHLYVRGENGVKKVEEDFKLPPADIVVRVEEDQEADLDALIRFNGFEAEMVKGNSYFSYAFPVRSKMDAENAYLWTKLQHTRATHVSVRARLKTGTGSYIEFGHDDGETQAELQINEAIYKAKLANTMVVVVHYYGGSHLNNLHLKTVFNAASAACKAMCSQSGIIDLSEHLVDDGPVREETDRGESGDLRERSPVVQKEGDEAGKEMEGEMDLDLGLQMVVQTQEEECESAGEQLVVQSGTPKDTVDNGGDSDSGMSNDLLDPEKGLDPYADEGSEEEDIHWKTQTSKKTRQHSQKKKRNDHSYADAAKTQVLNSNKLAVASPVAGRTRDGMAKRNLSVSFSLAD